ncbi:MAG: hypothetical protein JRM74_05685 [Nitrososphaerota archaeon]|nr:hypothetical protein [Nitrososphaerota archaeon]
MVEFDDAWKEFVAKLALPARSNWPLGTLNNRQLLNWTIAMSTSISVDRKTKDSLARQKRAMEASEGVKLTWDQFFERALSVRRPPKLTRVEIEELKKIAAEARPWKTRS